MKKLILILALIVAAPVVVQAEQNPIEIFQPKKHKRHDRSFLGIGDGRPGVFGIGTGQNLSSRNYSRWNAKRREFKSFAALRLPDGIGKKGGKK